MAHDAPASFVELRDERLSAYLDGELPDGERVAVEIEIADDATMRADLEGLRQVRDGLRELEIVPAPRSFALTAPPARPATWFGMPRLDLAMRTGAAVAAFAFAIVLVGDIGGATGGGAARDSSNALIASPVLLSRESTAGGAGEVEAAPRAPEPQATPMTSQAGDVADDGDSSPATTSGAPLGEATAARFATEDGSGDVVDASADAGVKPATASDAPTEQATPPDAGGQVAPSGGTTTLASPSTGTPEPGASGATSGAAGGSTDTSTDRAIPPPPPATGVEPATSEDEGTKAPPLTEETTTSATTAAADEPAASPQPALASPVVRPESAVPSLSASDAGASAAAIALGALAVLLTGTSLVLWRRRST